MARIAKEKKIVGKGRVLEGEKVKGGLRAFKKSSDLEEFYSFVYENGLRWEAFQALNYIAQQVFPLVKKKKGRGAKAKRLH